VPQSRKARGGVPFPKLRMLAARDGESLFEVLFGGADIAFLTIQLAQAPRQLGIIPSLVGALGRVLRLGEEAPCLVELAKPLIRLGQERAMIAGICHYLDVSIGSPAFIDESDSPFGIPAT
jgi:hypothetical protein